MMLAFGFLALERHRVEHPPARPETSSPPIDFCWVNLRRLGGLGRLTTRTLAVADY